LMMSLWDALRMNMMISYQELVRTFPKYCSIESKRIDRQLKDRFDASLTRLARTNISFIKQIPGTDDHITINMHLVESTYLGSAWKRKLSHVKPVFCTEKFSRE
ncbi:hypothetical protein OGY18_02945, partial [Citrobacter sp. Cpo142]|nr:hypothetical protein [Enterobacter hormaechei]MDF3669504.1 hypothetical protein [Enterobacter hormaechei]MDM2776122.1 hypothetical protein [Citrobacter sp. Cpo142]MDM2899113.1 hypothetical protein [Citrobacter sp. Cpo037]